MPDEELRKKILGDAYPGFNFSDPGIKRVDIASISMGVQLSIIDNNECYESVCLNKSEIKKLIATLLEEI